MSPDNCQKLRIVGFLMLLVFFLNNGCEKIPFYGIIEGVVEYMVSYPEMAGRNSPLASLLPSKATMYFNTRYSAVEIAGLMGFFRLNVISDSKGKILRAYLKVLTTKIYTVYDTTEILRKLGEYPQYCVIEPQHGKRIKYIGLECFRYYMMSLKPGTPDFEVLVTGEIKTTSPFWYTPFNSMGGFLLKYDIRHFDVYMRFEATSVKSVDVPGDIFKHDTSYKYVEPSRFEEEIKLLLKQFSS